MTVPLPNAFPPVAPIRLTTLSQGGGCGNKIAPGVLSAAPKPERLPPEGYAAMIASTTRSNTPGRSLSALDGVHALTDVTGFGLLGHTLELARGARLAANLSWSKVPLIADAFEPAAAGCVTGASDRNLSGYGQDVRLAPGIGATERALLTDPQTSAGLLAACSPETVEEILSVFLRDGFEQAAVVGAPAAGEPVLEVGP